MAWPLLLFDDVAWRTGANAPRLCPPFPGCNRRSKPSRRLSVGFLMICHCKLHQRPTMDHI
jgi:hypothetical protein